MKIIVHYVFLKNISNKPAVHRKCIRSYFGSDILFAFVSEI